MEAASDVERVTMPAKYTSIHTRTHYQVVSHKGRGRATPHGTHRTAQAAVRQANALAKRYPSKTLEVNRVTPVYHVSDGDGKTLDSVWVE